MIQTNQTYEWINIKELYNTPFNKVNVRLVCTLVRPVSKSEFQKFYDEILRDQGPQTCYEMMKQKFSAFVNQSSIQQNDEVCQFGNDLIIQDIQDSSNFILIEFPMNAQPKREGIYNINGEIRSLPGHILFAIKVHFYREEPNANIKLLSQSFQICKQKYLALQEQARIKIINF